MAADQTMVLFLVLSVTFNIIIAPLLLYLGKRGVWLQIMKFKMKKGNIDAFAFIDKSNNINLHFEDRDGSRVEYKGGSYASTPIPTKLYRLWGIPLRLRRENDPEDIDIWERPGNIDMTAKELDNIVNEAKGTGLAEILRQYFPVVIVVVGILILVSLGAIYLNYVNMEVLKQIAPDVMKQVMSLQ